MHSRVLQQRQRRASLGGELEGPHRCPRRVRPSSCRSSVWLHSRLQCRRPPQPLDTTNHYGTDNADTLTGGPGKDRFIPRAGADVVLAGRGRGAVDPSRGHDYLKGGRGPDAINGGRGGDNMYGTQGEDELNGSQGRDRMRGGNRFDLLRPGGGGDRVSEASVAIPSRCSTTGESTGSTAGRARTPCTCFQSGGLPSSRRTATAAASGSSSRSLTRLSQRQGVLPMTDRGQNRQLVPPAVEDFTEIRLTRGCSDPGEQVSKQL